MNPKTIDKFIQAGTIAAQAVVYARSIVKKDVPLLVLAEQIEGKIVALGGKPAFPVNLSINEIAAHATPRHDDTGVAHGLLKVDLGVHVEGYIADTAFSVDLENSAAHTKLIAAAEAGLAAALLFVMRGVSIGEIGRVISEAIHAKGVVPIANLSGHAIEKYEIHAGITLPNYDNGDTHLLMEGVYAIEPFTTLGEGKVQDGKPSGIYQLMKEGNVRDSIAREVLAFIIDTYQTLPFCARWIHKKFGARGLLGLKFIEQAGLLHHFAQLVEISKSAVAQAEHTIIVQDKDVIVTTR